MWPGLVLVSLRCKDVDYTHCHVVALALQALMALHIHTIALLPSVWSPLLCRLLCSCPIALCARPLISQG